MHTLISRRIANLTAAIGCAVLLAVAYFYMENYLFLVPCPLCYAQRFVIAGIGIISLIACLFPGQRKAGIAYAITSLLMAIGGAALSIRHLYLQHTPQKETVACGQDFYALIESTPIAEAVQTMITGGGDCGEIQWTLAGISIPGWTLVAFIGLGLWLVWNNALRRS